MKTLKITDDLERLLAVLPAHIRQALEQPNRSTELIEINGSRLPEARFGDGEVYLSDSETTTDDLR